MMALPTDELLLSASVRGDADAFSSLAARYGPALDSYFRRRLPDDGRVEELRQETLLAVFALLPSYRERGRFRSLLFSIAYRKLVSARRAQPATSPLPEELAAAPVSAGAFEVRAAVDRLPASLREALLLTIFEGFHAAEAGEVLGCSAEAVRARVCRAKTLLAKFFNPGSRRTP
jgi:RNA polymerase sigma factor (sigma-70 family)